jgi:hypothetical protein
MPPAVPPVDAAPPAVPPVDVLAPATPPVVTALVPPTVAPPDIVAPAVPAVVAFAPPAGEPATALTPPLATAPPLGVVPLLLAPPVEEPVEPALPPDPTHWPAESQEGWAPCSAPQSTSSHGVAKIVLNRISVEVRMGSPEGCTFGSSASSQITAAEASAQRALSARHDAH